MTGARLLRAVLLLLLARGRATHAFSHPRRSDVYGGGADTLVEDHREYDAFGELRHVNENDASYTDADVSSPDAWSRADDARRRGRRRHRARPDAARTRARTRAWGRARCLAASTRARRDRVERTVQQTSKPLRVTRVAPARARRAAGRGSRRRAVRLARTHERGDVSRCVLDRPASTDTPHDTHTSAFASERRIGFVDVPATPSAARARCVSPARTRAGVVAVAVSADGVVFSADSGAAAMPRGGGGFAFFEYVDGPRPGTSARTTPPARTRAGRR